MIVYVLINKYVDKNAPKNIITQIVGVYSNEEIAMEQYFKYVDKGQYAVYPMVLDQTVLNVGI